MDRIETLEKIAAQCLVVRGFQKLYFENAKIEGRFKSASTKRLLVQSKVAEGVLDGLLDELPQK